MEDPRTLPAGYAHPHASEEARVIAEQGLILRAQVGSGVHGTAIGGQDDRDEIAAVEEAEARLLHLRQHATVPEQPDRAWVDGWLHRSYLDHWHANSSPRS